MGEIIPINLNTTSLFDSAHDFGSKGLCNDSLTNIVKDRIRTKNYNYIVKFIFTLLGKYGYGLSIDLLKQNSRLAAYLPVVYTKFPEITLKQLEDYFIFGFLKQNIEPGKFDELFKENLFDVNIKDKIKELTFTGKKFNVTLIKNVKKNKILASDYETLVSTINTELSDYKIIHNSKNLVPLVIDTQISLLKFIKKSVVDTTFNEEFTFTYLINQEMINDRGTKLNYTRKHTNKLYPSIYLENESPRNERQYTGTNTDGTGSNIDGFDLSKCTGFFDVKFNVIQEDSKRKKAQVKVDFTSKIDGKNMSYYKTLNDSINGIPHISSVINKLQKDKKTLKELHKICSEDNLIEFDTLRDGNGRLQIDYVYKEIERIYNALSDNKTFNDFYFLINYYYYRKRFGDQLMANSCSKTITYDKISQDGKRDSSDTLEVDKSIFVTCDRMAATYALMNNIPVILENGKKDYILVITPTKDSTSSSGGSLVDINNIYSPKIEGHETDEKLEINEINEETMKEVIEEIGADTIISDDDKYEDFLIKDQIIKNPIIFLRCLYHLILERGTIIPDKGKFNSSYKSIFLQPDIEIYDLYSLEPEHQSRYLLINDDKKKLLGDDHVNDLKDGEENLRPITSTFIHISKISKISGISTSKPLLKVTYESGRLFPGFNIELHETGKTISSDYNINVLEHPDIKSDIYKYIHLIETNNITTFEDLSNIFEQSGGSNIDKKIQVRDTLEEFYKSSESKIDKLHNNRHMSNILFLKMYLYYLQFFELINLSDFDRTEEYYHEYLLNNNVVGLLIPQNTELYSFVKVLVKYIKENIENPEAFSMVYLQDCLRYLSENKEYKYRHFVSSINDQLDKVCSYFSDEHDNFIQREYNPVTVKNESEKLKNLITEAESLNQKFLGDIFNLSITIEEVHSKMADYDFTNYFFASTFSDIEDFLRELIPKLIEQSAKTPRIRSSLKRPNKSVLNDPTKKHLKLSKSNSNSNRNKNSNSNRYIMKVNPEGYILSRNPSPPKRQKIGRERMFGGMNKRTKKNKSQNNKAPSRKKKFTLLIPKKGTKLKRKKPKKQSKHK